MSRSSLRAGALALLLALPECTPIPEQIPVKPPSPLPVSRREPGAPRVPWGEKNRDERMEFMGLTFFPKMRALFQERDPKHPFRCQTCHGEDMEAVSYRMPHGLYALPRTDPVAAARDYDPEETRFMVEAVLPAATALLGREAAAEPGCHLCHESE